MIFRANEINIKMVISGSHWFSFLVSFLFIPF